MAHSSSQGFPSSPEMPPLVAVEAVSVDWKRGVCAAPPRNVAGLMKASVTEANKRRDKNERLAIILFQAVYANGRFRRMIRVWCEKC